MLDMVDTHTDTDMLDTTASVRLMLSLRPSLILIFCTEVMAMAMLDTLDMLDTMDTPMLDMPTMDKLQPNRKRTEQPSFFSSSVTTNFQCLTCFLVTDGRKHRESYILNKDTFCIEFHYQYFSLSFIYALTY